MYELVSTQLYLDNAQVFDVLENIVIMAVIPISTFVVVVVATAATVVQLKRAITWRQRASANVDGTEVVCWRLFAGVLLLLFVYLFVFFFSEPGSVNRALKLNYKLQLKLPAHKEVESETPVKAWLPYPHSVCIEGN